MEAASAHLHSVFPMSTQSSNLSTSFGIKGLRKISESLQMTLSFFGR
jgi:hypothetical protein